MKGKGWAPPFISRAQDTVGLKPPLPLRLSAYGKTFPLPIPFTKIISYSCVCLQLLFQFCPIYKISASSNIQERFENLPVWQHYLTCHYPPAYLQCTYRQKRPKPCTVNPLYNDVFCSQTLWRYTEFAVIKNIYLEQKTFRANQNDVIKNFAVVMGAVIKKVDCS